MSGPWRKIENENGYASYYNENTNIKQWDHPKFADIKQSIDECNYIKFSSYRVAAKIRALQRALYMDEIGIAMIMGIFEKHRLGMNEASLHLESYDLEAILSDIYFAANKQNHTNTDIDFATELMQNFLYTVYDKERKGKLQVISTKIVLGVLSNAKLSELYRYLYTLCADYNNSVTRYRLQNVLTHLTAITGFLHEDMHFGQQLIQTTLESCFKQYPGGMGMSEVEFTDWLETSPQLVGYLGVLYRMRCAERVTHATWRCSVCKVTPLVGLRYRCLRCPRRYTQCQRCFLAARTSHQHKHSHAMREYCTEKCSRETGMLVVKRMLGLLRCSLRLPSPEFTEPRSLRGEREGLLLEPDPEPDSPPQPLSSPQQQLNPVIRQLELQNKELQNQMGLFPSRDKEMRRYLEEHRMHIAAQIQKLKILKEYLASQASSTSSVQVCGSALVESTPLVVGGRGRGLQQLEPYSPIVRPPDFSAIAEADSTQHHTPSVDNVFANTVDAEQPLSIRDISTWIADRGGGGTSSSSVCGGPPGGAGGMQSELDAVLEKLQQILAVNLSAELEDSTRHNNNPTPTL